jgi:hypothetical protein
MIPHPWHHGADIDMPGRQVPRRQRSGCAREVAAVDQLAAPAGDNRLDPLPLPRKEGLTPYQALRTGTYHPAEYFGQLSERGTVAVGKWADLVLLPASAGEHSAHARPLAPGAAALAPGDAL